MKMILLEKVPKLGNVGDVIDVKGGYARNFLLPRKLATNFTDKTLHFIEKKKKMTGVRLLTIILRNAQLLYFLLSITGPSMFHRTLVVIKKQFSNIILKPVRKKTLFSNTQKWMWADL